ncbi:hypothetical protein [Bosea vaviloviae]|uniref:Uncharacterized protein n=1 Tax=Bosea vaviloviae TaxID=1526658 RepID=A0A0N1F2E9_9HYPH|nr:hypothetical protein [Bosea vaviloviae]KPH79371.1 hypothetical protein AE618_18970 [Bosea vaviloviae]
MSNINELIAKAKVVAMSAEQRAQQRRNFAFGSSNIENDRITRDTVSRAEGELREGLVTAVAKQLRG